MAEMKQVPDHSYLSTLLDCPRMFFHRYVENLEPKSEAVRLSAGSAMHLGLAQLYKDWDLEKAVEILKESYTVTPMGDLDFLTVGHLETVLRNYYDRWHERDPFKVVSLIEEPIVEEIDGMEVGGIPDLVVDEDGEVIVLDHKTTSSYLGSHLYNRVKFSKQGPIYCLLLSKRLGVEVRRIIFNCIYTGKYTTSPTSKAQKFDRYSFEFSESELEETKSWLLHVLTLINHFEEDDESLWPQHGGSHCGWCDYSSLCEVAPTLREGVKARTFEIRERTGILLSGADE